MQYTCTLSADVGIVILQQDIAVTNECLSFRGRLPSSRTAIDTRLTNCLVKCNSNYNTIVIFMVDWLEYRYYFVKKKLSGNSMWIHFFLFLQKTWVATWSTTRISSQRLFPERFVARTCQRHESIGFISGFALCYAGEVSGEATTSAAAKLQQRKDVEDELHPAEWRKSDARERARASQQPRHDVTAQHPQHAHRDAAARHRQEERLPEGAQAKWSQ